jgi:hypothetical protein
VSWIGIRGGDSGDYHFYPTDEQVRKWLAEAGFTAEEIAEGDGYQHYPAHR